MSKIEVSKLDFKGFLATGSLYVDKTLNISMLKYFFNIKDDKSLFNGLNIAKEKELCEKHQKRC
jgi:hypothetical protein